MQSRLTSTVKRFAYGLETFLYKGSETDVPASSIGATRLGAMSPPNSGFDASEPFANPVLLKETMDALGGVEFKLFGKRPLDLYGGAPTKYEFDWNLGLIHVTEQDFRALAEVFRLLNEKWGTEMTFCLYPSKERPRDIILNVRGSPLAPSEID